MNQFISIAKDNPNQFGSSFLTTLPIFAIRKYSFDATMEKLEPFSVIVSILILGFYCTISETFFFHH